MQKINYVIMFLSKLQIVNYRSCKNILLDFSKDDPSIFIGINDSGKSTILDAIGCVLGEKARLEFKCEGKISSDLSNTQISEEEFNQIFSNLSLPLVNYDNQSIYLIGFFDIEDEDIQVIDDQASNHLKWSVESFSGDKIVVLKKYFENSSLAYLCSSNQNNNHDCDQLWNATKTSLSSIIKNLDISKAEIENENGKGPFKNLEIVRAVYKKIQVDNQWNTYNEYQKDLKSVFPTYRYFDAKISMDDVKKIAIDVLRGKIGSYKSQLSAEALRISGDASNDVNQELSEISDNIFADLNNVKKLKIGLSFNVEESISDVIIEKDSADGDVKLDSQGQGTKKQIWLSLIRWQSLKDYEPDNTGKKVIWCFDEPEIHLFPGAQRDLFNDIKKISNGVVQSFICTHSTIFIDKFNLESIRQISLNSGYSVVSLCTGVFDVHDSLGVKNSDILFYDKFFVLEGETDYYLMPHFYKLLKKRTIGEDNIQLINLKGKDNRDNNNKLFNQILSDFKKPDNFVYYFFDGDSLLPAGDNVCVIGSQDIEDSLSNDIWISLISSYCGFTVKSEELDLLRSQIGLGHNAKFYKLLNDFIMKHSDNIKKIHLPSKGDRLSTELIKIINNEDLIPDCIKEFLLKI